jgi:hypothetical protein
MAANRVGKTEGAGGYEMTCHLTGRYPDWWEGRRFSGPVRAWAAGKTNETTRDVPGALGSARGMCENSRQRAIHISAIEDWAEPEFGPD